MQDGGGRRLELPTNCYFGPLGPSCGQYEAPDKLVQIGLELAEIPTCVFSRWWPPPSWMLPKVGSWILHHSNPQMAIVYQPTKFDAYIFIGDWDMAKNKMQDGGRCHLKFPTNAILGPYWHLYGLCEAAHQMWCKFVSNWPRYTCLCIFKIAAATILNFTESWILGYSNPRMANVYPPTKFDASIFIGHRYMAEKQNPTWQDGICVQVTCQNRSRLHTSLQSREWVTQSDPWPKWPIELLTHDPCDPWPMGHWGRHPIGLLAQIYWLPGTVFGHCICTHTFKLLHNCTCKQTAHTGTCKFRVC